MNYKQILKISSDAKYMFNGDKVIIFNRTNRQWLKISKECYDILMQYNGNYTIQTLMDNLADDDDRIYLKKVLEALSDMKILGEKTKRKLHDVSFAISNRCNLSCKHCMVNAESCSTSECFNTEQIKIGLSKIIDSNPEIIVITGGEPLVRKDFAEIITYLRERFDGEISLMTNGTLINETNVKLICKCVDSISISLDGANEETVSLIRGRGVFNKVKNAINLLHKNSFSKISLSMVITADNALYVDDFFSLCKELKCKPLLRALSLTGQAEKNKKLLTTRQITKENAVATADIDRNKERQSFYTCSCNAGTTTLTIEKDGGIYPCNLFVEPEYCLGNILSIKSIDDILQKKETEFISDCLNEFEPDRVSECKNCNISYFCWSCLHEIKDLKESGTLKDRCKYNKQYLQKVWEE